MHREINKVKYAQIKLIGGTSVLALLILICSTGICSATDYFISNQGSDYNTGLSVDDAWATPSHAVSGKGTSSAVGPGDTIYLLDGIWHDAVIYFNVSGRPGNPITLTAYNDATPIIYTDKGHGTWGDNENGYFGIEVRGKEYINISGISMGGYRADIWIGNSDNIHISNMDLGKYGPYDSQFAVMMYYDVHNSSLTSSTCEGSYDNTVCVWGHTYGSDPLIPYASSYITIDGNTIKDSSTHNLIDLNGFLFNITISNNILTDEVYDTTGIWMHTYDEVYENISIINNSFQNCYRGVRSINTTNLCIIDNKFTDTGKGGSIRMYGKYHSDPDCTNRNVYVANNLFDEFVQAEGVRKGIFENNTIRSSKYYRFENSTDIKLRNEKGNNFKICADSNSNMVFEYTDNTRFVASKITGENIWKINVVNRFNLESLKLISKSLFSKKFLNPINHQTFP